MKKLLILLMLLPLMVSCTKDDDNSKPDNKIRTCYPIKINWGDNITILEYDSDNKLVKETFKEGALLMYTFTYDYTAGKLSRITKDDSRGGQTIYTVTTDNIGRITEVATPGKTRFYTFVYDNDSRLTNFSMTTNGLIDEQVTYLYQGTKIISGDRIYEIDGKSYAFKNSIYHFVFSYAHFPNNILSVSIKNQDGTIRNYSNNQYSYNSDGYPVSGKIIYSAGATMNFAFEYTCK